MLIGLAGKSKISLLIIWSLFSFSLVRIFSIFLYAISYIFVWYACLCALLFFSYYFIFKIRFHSKLSYVQYSVSNIIFIALIALFSYLYRRAMMPDNDLFTSDFFIAVLISNLLLGSLLFLLTLIKRK